MKKKIGDEVFVHGRINEIRGRTIIIENNGGYFGTDCSEVYAIPSCRYCEFSEEHGFNLFCKYWHRYTYWDGFCHFGNKAEDENKIEESVEVKVLVKEGPNHE